MEIFIIVDYFHFLKPRLILINFCDKSHKGFFYIFDLLLK